MIVYINKGTGVSGAVRYVMGEGRDEEGKIKELEPGHETRVEWTSGQGFGFAIDSPERVELARKVMEWSARPENQASRTKLCENDCFHASLSWGQDETPSRDEMELAARDYLKALGMERARAIFVAHGDTRHPHLHIVASRIDPETGLTFSDQMDRTKSQAWALKYERAHGIIRCPAREQNEALQQGVEAKDAQKILDHLTTNSPTFDRKDLDRALHRGGMKGAAEREQFGLEVLADGNVIGLRETADAAISRYTTRDVLAAERQVTRSAKGLAEDSSHSLNSVHQFAALDRHGHLDAEQRGAFFHATGPGGLALIAGEAGTGKSTTLAAVRDAYEAEGCRVIGMAWTHDVVKGLGHDGFRDTSTIAAELKRVEHGSSKWDQRTVLVVDEAAMLSTKHLAALTEKAKEAGAKLILAGDAQQFTSIERGGMFGALQREHGAAELHQVRRVSDAAQRKAFNLMHEGEFRAALDVFAERGNIQWRGTQEQARDSLIGAYARDSAQDPGKTRFAFAYTNADVAALNHGIRAIRRERGELGEDHILRTKDGLEHFATGDRIQFTGTARRKAQREAGLSNGTAGTVLEIDGARITVALDTKKGTPARHVSFIVGDDHQLGEFASFRHGYAGTLYKGQGKTLDQTYLCYSQHWRAASSYVALSRHRETMTMFVAKEAAADIDQLARQMSRKEEKRAASSFVASQEYQAGQEPIAPSRQLAKRDDLGDVAAAVTADSAVQTWAKHLLSEMMARSDQRPAQPSQRPTLAANSESAAVHAPSGAAAAAKVAGGAVKVIADVMDGVASTLESLLGGGPSRVEQQELPKAPPPSQAEQIRTQRRARAAMEEISKRVQQGSAVDPGLLQSLTASQLRSIADGGDAYLKMVASRVETERDLERDGGRTRDR